VEYRPCGVQTVIEPPPAPPWVGDLPVTDGAKWWPGTLRAWRWIERARRIWTGLVDYSRDGLVYSNWVNGDLLEVLVADDPGTTRAPGSSKW
jgi:hypothetical protein